MKKTECEECGEVIPLERVQITRSKVCVECQESLERQGLVPKYRMEVLGGSSIESFENSALLSKVAPRKITGLGDE